MELLGVPLYVIVGLLVLVLAFGGPPIFGRLALRSYHNEQDRQDGDDERPEGGE